MSASSPTLPLQIRSRNHLYPVFVARDCRHEIGQRARSLPLLMSGGRCGVVTDDTVAPLYAKCVIGSLKEAGFNPTLVVFPAGEGSKTLAQAESIATELIRHGVDRHGFLVALGGGVVGDLAGFVASIYYRGIPYLQIPTTIVAQVDSAIGGKTAVNTVSGKNLLGTFHPPAMVLADVSTLATLPERVFEEGFAEVIKHGVIRDRALFDRLLYFSREDEAVLAEIISRNLEIKAEIVSADEYETLGVRALLNFGHTVGHGIEQAGGYGRYLHGEAVSLGMVAAARLSVHKAGLPPGELRSVVECLQRFHLPTILDREVETDAILASLRHDKKFEAGAIRFVLTPAIGQARLSLPGEVTEQDLRAAVERLRQPAD